MTDLYHWYHIYADGDWTPILDEHLRVLKHHGLLENLHTLFIGIVGLPHNREAVKAFIDSQGIPYVVSNETNDGWEQETLDHMNEWSQTHEGYGLYCHTKGAANFQPYNIHWRRNMTYYTAVDWKTSVQFMDEGYTTVGSQWIESEFTGQGHQPIPNTSFFAGTFFWVRLDMLRTINKPCRWHRYCAEHYVGVLQRKPNTYSSGSWATDPSANPCPSFNAEKDRTAEFKVMNRGPHSPMYIEVPDFWSVLY